MKQCKDKLTDRIKIMEDAKNQKSKERILIDEEIKKMIASCEEDLKHLRNTFKEFKIKNEKKVEKEELESRSKAIDLIRKNLNLL